MKRLGLIGSVALALACGGPIGPLAGGELSGTAATAALEPALVEDVTQVQLETNPDAPHSVNTWIGAASGAVYVPTSMIRGPLSPAERDWVKNVQADPRVRLRVDGTLYALRATRVEDAAEYEAARAALEAKYELGADDMDPAREIWLFRLEARE
ncbi:MAG: nitroreductase family deazaflavin-dependent oxidoreductase [Deltaproteobacteria bacterium]|nr:nitroreductase family deazaflavin-dependent oxidoreductase [Deltaproteobacteria bacterium]